MADEISKDGLSATFERRGAATKRIIDTLSHLSREKAMAVLYTRFALAWYPINEIEKLADFQERRN